MLTAEFIVIFARMLVFKDGAMISSALVPTFIALTKLTRIGISKSSLLFD